MQRDDYELTWEQSVQWLKDQPDQDALIKACYFDDPLASAAARYHQSKEWQAIRALLPPVRGSALDIGSGRGISAFALAKDGWHTTALEPNPGDVVGAGAIRRLASETETKICVVQTWGEDLPFQDCSFNIVHARQVLHHARDLGQLCREISRVLRPNGKLIATREHVLSKKGDLGAFLDAHPLHHLYGGENAFTLDEYLGAITEAGIRLIKVLNPLESEINTHPETIRSVKERLALKLRLPSAAFVPNFFLSLVGKLSSSPGRLYTFLGEKRP
jgi:SAM-dependent methyltransferase